MREKYSEEELTDMLNRRKKTMDAIKKILSQNDSKFGEIYETVKETIEGYDSYRGCQRSSTTEKTSVLRFGTQNEAKLEDYRRASTKKTRWQEGDDITRTTIRSTEFRTIETKIEEIDAEIARRKKLLEDMHNDKDSDEYDKVGIIIFFVDNYGSIKNKKFQEQLVPNTIEITKRELIEAGYDPEILVWREKEITKPDAEQIVGLAKERKMPFSFLKNLFKQIKQRSQDERNNDGHIK